MANKSDIWLMRRESMHLISALNESNKLEAARGGVSFYEIDAKGTLQINIVGPLFAKKNAWSNYFGWTTYEDIHEALDRATTAKEIVLLVDSPGGEVTMCSSVATRLAGINKPKSVRVFGMCCSAAYWIASGAGNIEVEDTSAVGSVGVVAVYRVDPGIVSITSSNAENKRPDVTTDEGKAVVRGEIDEIERVFIDAVAKNRGMTRDDVITKFGRGSVKVGRDAVSAGMADRLTEYKEAKKMNDTTAQDTKDVTASIEAVKQQERERILGIQAIAPVGLEALADMLVGNGSSVESAAVAFLKAQKENEGQVAKNRAEDAAGVPDIKAPVPDVSVAIPQKEEMSGILALIDKEIEEV